MSPELQFTVAVFAAPTIFGVAAWAAVEFRSLRKIVQDHATDDLRRFQTQDAARAFESGMSNRLARIESDVRAIRQAVAPLPHQGGVE